MGNRLVRIRRAIVLTRLCTPEPETLRRVMRALPCLLIIGACVGGQSPPDLHRDSILGGQSAPNDDFAFFLEGAEGACTATLIAPRTLLTAAHCVALGRSMWVTNAPTSDAGAGYLTVESQTFGEANDAGLQVDLALLLLDRAPPVAVKPWVWSGPAPMFDTPIRHVGYGRTETGTVGERRSVEVAVIIAAETKASGIVIETGRPGLGICFGDSGGPALIDTDAGERIIAVHSFVTASCGNGTSVLLYPYRTFIEAWLAKYEAPTCARDGRCVAGCEDPDCVCPADGLCDLRCPAFDDLDCPVSCGADGLCEDTLTCPVGDDDCVPLGSGCAREMQCAGRQCITDPQHSVAYCSVHCDNANPCPSRFVCEPIREVCQHAQLPEAAEGEACVADVTVCVRGSECHEARCRRSCVSQVQCGEDTRCDFERHLCMPAEITVSRAVVVEPAAKSGCSVAPFSSFGLVVLVLGALKKSKRVRDTNDAITRRLWKLPGRHG